jgi:hypothetical protein
MESNIPKNSINTPLEDKDGIEYFKQENRRVRENNVNLKLEVIETKSKLLKILEIINK